MYQNVINQGGHPISQVSLTALLAIVTQFYADLQSYAVVHILGVVLFLVFSVVNG